MGVLEQAQMVADILVAVAVLVPATLAALAAFSKRVRVWMFDRLHINLIERKLDHVGNDLHKIKHRQYALIVTRDEPKNLDVDAISQENDLDLDQLNNYLKHDKIVLQDGGDEKGD